MIDTEVNHLLPHGRLTYKQHQVLLQASSLLPASIQRPGGARSKSFLSAASSAGGSFRGVLFSFEDGSSSFGQGMFHSPQPLYAPAEPHRGGPLGAVAMELNMSCWLLHSWCSTTSTWSPQLCSCRCCGTLLTASLQRSVKVALKRCTVSSAMQARSSLWWAAIWCQIILLCLSKQQ